VEDRLLGITYKCFTMLDKHLDEELMARFPSGWTDTPRLLDPPLGPG
jgi:hypothetical protein